MQTNELPTIFESSDRGASHTPDRTLLSSSSARPFSFPSLYTEHCAPAADAAFERRAGQAMHILALPPPTSQPPTPFGRRQELGSSLAKFPHQFSPARSEQHSYPSPPMSDSHSPARRSAQISEPEGHPYPPRSSEPHRTGGLAPLPPPPPQSLYDPRSAPSGRGVQHQRPLYPGEPHHAGGQMLHYQTGRAVEPPSYGGMHVTQSYTYGYPGVPSHLGGYGPGPQGQPSAIAPPPLRPNKPARRTKAHVASACVNCKKAHLSCDVQRPCGRCVSSGKQDSCKDVQHKKRGRPRLRDDKEFGRGDDGRQVAPSQLLGPSPATGSDPYTQQPAFASSHRATDPLRVVGRAARGSEDISNTRPQSISSAPGGGPPSRVGSFGGALYAAGPNLGYQSLPVAFLNLDLVVLKANQAFQDLVAFSGDVRGKSLMEMLENRQVDVLQRISNELREERDEREPAYMAPITPLGQDPVQLVEDRDVDHVSQGFVNRPFLLNFRLPNSRYQSLQTQIRLAKTSLYFVTVVVHTPPRPAGPPLLTQQLAPPTPIRASQTLSAPTAPTREYGPYSARPSSSASSAPTSPYFNFSSVRTSLPTISSSSYGNSPSYNYSPTAGPEQGYFSTIQPPAQPGSGYPSPYPPLSRTGSMTSEPLRERDRPARLEGLQLPPIRTGRAPSLAPPLASPLGHEFSESAREQRIHNVRKYETSPTSVVANPNTPDPGKRRRLNIHEVLE